MVFVVSVFAKASSVQDSLKQHKVESIGIFCSFIPFSRTYHLKNENITGIQLNFVPKNKFTIGLFGFYATNKLTYKYNSEIAYNPQTTGDLTGQKVLINFIGRQFGLGGSIYYELIKSKNFVLSPGINTSISFFTKASAEYSTINLVYDSLFKNIHYSLGPTRKTEDYSNLKDNLPDIFLINLNSKCQFLSSKRFRIYAEPFLSLIGIYKNLTIRLPNIGTNIGMTYQL